MAEPTKEDLDAVFLVGEGDPRPPPTETMGEDSEEMEAALDASIDEFFAAEDPMQRREAFKRAIRLCKEQEY